jgi:hypothetical protein
MDAKMKAKVGKVNVSTIWSIVQAVAPFVKKIAKKIVDRVRARKAEKKKS